CELPEKYPGSSLRWTYDSEKAISGRRTAKSGLFIIEKGDRVLGRDKISGKIGLTRFSLSVTKLFREKSRHKRRLRSGGEEDVKSINRNSGVYYFLRILTNILKDTH